MTSYFPNALSGACCNKEEDTCIRCNLPQGDNMKLPITCMAYDWLFKTVEEAWR